MSTYNVSCECGSRVSVTATQAGSQLPCSCGRIVSVPLLSVLRREAGQPSIVLDTVQRIELMVSKGELPSGAVCPVSGRIADHTLQIFIECERTWIRGGERGDGFAMAALLLFGRLGQLLAQRSERPQEELGREVSVTVPVRVSSEAVPNIKRMSSKALRQLLTPTPIYAQLLEEYPLATLSVTELRW